MEKRQQIPLSVAPKGRAEEKARDSARNDNFCLGPPKKVVEIRVKSRAKTEKQIQFDSK